MMIDTASMIWWISIAIFLTVTVVVAVLLTLILRTARTILDVVADIWTTGKMVANNTIHIPLLVETNRIAGSILNEAGQIAEGAAVIQDHAENCPGCPDCVLGI